MGKERQCLLCLKMRTQLVAARTITELLADIATGKNDQSLIHRILEIAMSKNGKLADAAKSLLQSVAIKSNRRR